MFLLTKACLPGSISLMYSLSPSLSNSAQPISKSSPSDLWRSLDEITELQQQQQQQQLEEQAAAASGTPLCRFFLSGGCRRGGACGFRHDRPLCRFVMALGGCMYGEECR